MPHSVIEAIKLGIWDYEPDCELPPKFKSTVAMPGTNEKLTVLAARVEQGLPLWHPSDRINFEDDEA